MTGWPSGLRRWIKAPISSGAWVRIPLQSSVFGYGGRGKNRTVRSRRQSDLDSNKFTKKRNKAYLILVKK